MEKSEPDFVFKVLLLGEAAVGKTSLTNRFVKAEFSTNYSVTLCLDVMRKSLKVGPHRVNLQIWDTVGQERFRTITSSYYKGTVRSPGSKGILLCFSVANRQSFDTIVTWMDNIREYADVDTLAIFIVGNKTDLADERQVAAKEAQDLAASLCVPYFETSAKAGDNVELIFAELCKQMIDKDKASGGPTAQNKIPIEKSKDMGQNLNMENMLKKQPKKFKACC